MCQHFLLLPANAQQQKFPDWMDQVEFKRNGSNNQEFEFSAPSAPIDPETGQASEFKSSNQRGVFKKPKLPDFEELRKKAIKATLERRASDTSMFEDSIKLSDTNQQKLKKSSNELETLLQTITDPVAKKRLQTEKSQIDNKLSAISQLLKLIGKDPTNLQNNLSNLGETEYKQALELQRSIFGKPSSSAAIKPPGSLFDDKKKSTSYSKKKSQRFYTPGKFKSFYHESKEEENRESGE